MTPQRPETRDRLSMGEVERAAVLSLLRRWGRDTTSFQLLHSNFRYFHAGPSATVGYVDTGQAWVAAGSPLAAPDKLSQTAQAFERAARHCGRRALFFAVGQHCADRVRLRSLLIGRDPVLDPATWPATLAASPSLRQQLSRARSKNVRVRALAPAEVRDPSGQWRTALERLIGRWQHHKPLPPMQFLVQVAPFAFPEERRLFVALRGDEPVGMASVAPIYARHGWFIENLIRAPDAPNGTNELLVNTALQDAAALGSRHVTLGLAPLSGDVGTWLRWLGRSGSGLYDFSGLERFKNKFRPVHWNPVYACFGSRQSAPLAIYDSLAAFAGGGLTRFGVSTLLRPLSRNGALNQRAQFSNSLSRPDWGEGEKGCPIARLVLGRFPRFREVLNRPLPRFAGPPPQR